MSPAILVLGLALPLAAADQPTFAFPDFASQASLKLVQSARSSKSALRLTPAVRDRAGAVWYTGKQTVASGFDTTFQFQLTQQGGLGHGVDGLAFVVQNSGPHAIAGQGASGGFAIGEGIGSHETPGIPHSIAVFFDTYHNQEISDPSDNFLVISTNGSFTEMSWPPARLGLTTALHTKLKDRKVHTVRIVYRPPVLTVFLDNRAAPILTSAIDLSVVTDAEGAAWVGFTASTGGGYENHDILNWSFTAGPKPDVSSSMSFVSSNVVFLKTACLPDRNLCTPERATIEETGGGRYHVILPAHIEVFRTIHLGFQNFDNVRLIDPYLP